MSNIDTLRDELTDARYAGMTAEEAAADLNTKRFPGDLSVADIRSMLLKTGEIDNVLEAAEGLGGASAPKQRIALRARFLLAHSETIQTSDDTERATFEGQLDALAVGGATGFDFWSAQTAADIKALYANRVSRAGQLGIGLVKPGHVEEARRL